MLTQPAAIATPTLDELIRRARAGEPAGIAGLYDRFSSGLFRADGLLARVAAIRASVGGVWVER